MTELLTIPVTVKLDAHGAPLSIRVHGGGHRRMERVLNQWRVETDWWRAPVRRDYWRCLLDGGDCVEFSHDLTASDRGDGCWSLVRRYD